MTKRITLGMLGVFIACSLAAGDVRLPSLFSDHLVLQAGVKVPVWGWGDKGEKVVVGVAGQEKVVTAGEDGKWRVELEPMQASATALELRVEGKNQIRIRDVLVGEVWLCSGQSNMEMHVRDARDAEKEISSAKYPAIRMFTAEHQATEDEKEDVKGKWAVCGPENVAEFSAVGYFFGRELHRELAVPVGLVHSSWGGTPAESWTSRAVLENEAGLKDAVEKYKASLKDLPAKMKEFEQAKADWEKKYLTQDPGIAEKAKGWSAAAFDDSKWKTMKLPGMWEAQGLKIDGAVWFRKTIEVPAEWAGKDLVLKLGRIDDWDTTFFNGEQVGATGKENALAVFVKREYRVPGKLVKAGKNVIAVRVFDRQGPGGFGAVAGEMKIEKADKQTGRQGDKEMALAGEWKYEVELAVVEKKDVPWGPWPPVGPNTAWAPANLWNGMIKPLAPYALRGAIWYQGESNAGKATEYQKLLTAMITSWRKEWGEGDFPFLIVQLANFMKPATQPVEKSDWALLREAQAKVAATVKNCGLATAIDIGEAADIHPKNKQEVGRRLALEAMKIAYSKNVVSRGPVYSGMKVDGAAATIEFDHAGGLHFRGEKMVGFGVAGADGKWVVGDARLFGESVVVSGKGVKEIKQVRYDWADNPAGNLYNAAELPAEPFRAE